MESHADFRLRSKESSAESEEARDIFRGGVDGIDDPFEVTVYDADHSFEEHRFITLGQMANGRIIVLCYKEERADLYRIISARDATPRERKDYEEEEI